MNSTLASLTAIGCSIASLAGLAADEQPQGQIVIRSQAGPAEIVITTTPRLAGAIHSLTWNGEEFIDSTDHGRQLHQVTFGLPVDERHTYAQFEAVTGYMPARFERFWKYNSAAQSLESLSDGPGEQAAPVVLATASGSHAMGVFSPDQPSQGFEQAGYGRFRFAAERVTKWNCVFRLKDPAGVPPGDYSFRCFVIVGDLETVRQSLAALSAGPRRSAAQSHHH